MFRRSLVLREENKDPTDGGGGGGAKPLTEEDVGRIANQAFTAQMKRLDIPGQITKALGGLDIDGKLNAFVEQFKKPDEADTKKKSGDQTELEKKFKEMSDRLEASETARITEAKAREELQTQHQFEQARSKLYETLKPHADSTLHDVWVDHLVHHKRLKVEDGNPLLEVEYAPVKGMPKQKEFLPMDEAVKHLVESQDSKRFMAVADPAGPQRNGGPRQQSRGAQPLDMKNPADRVRARLQKYGVNSDTEFG